MGWSAGFDLVVRLSGRGKADGSCLAIRGTCSLRSSCENNRRKSVCLFPRKKFCHLEEYMRHTPETDEVFPHAYSFKDGTHSHKNFAVASATSLFWWRIFRLTSHHRSRGSKGGCFWVSSTVCPQPRRASLTCPRGLITSCFIRSILKRSAPARPKSANKSA